MCDGPCSASSSPPPVPPLCREWLAGQGEGWAEELQKLYKEGRGAGQRAWQGVELVLVQLTKGYKVVDCHLPDTFGWCQTQQAAAFSTTQPTNSP